MGNRRIISGVYSITNINDGKRYIGCASSIYRRWDAHKHHLRRNISKHTHLQKAWSEEGEDSFVFSILEITSLEDLFKTEDRWILYFKTYLPEFGYNTLVTIHKELSRKYTFKDILGRQKKGYVCINISTNDIIRLKGQKKVIEKTGVKENKIWEYCSYWRGASRKRSYNGWIIIREEDYKEDFDYIGFKKVPIRKKKEKKSRYIKKTPEEYIKREDRDLKRVAVIAVNIETGEEKFYRMIKDVCVDFDKGKVYKCIKAPYGKYKHRGHYFKRVEG